MIDINEIASKIQEKKNDALARAFTMQIGMLLKENGIIPVAMEYTKQDIDNITNANEYKLVCEYGVCFNELDTYEHDKKIRADERAKLLKSLRIFLTQSNYRSDGYLFDLLDNFEKFKELEGEQKNV